MEFINHMNLDPDEIVSVEDIAPPSEDGTVVLTFGHPRSGANGQRLSTLTRKLSGENSPAQTMLESSERINQQNNSWIHSVSAPFVECIVQNALCLLRTVYKLLTQYLDLFGKPSREFLKKLFPFAEEPSSVVFFLLTSFNRFGWRLEIFFPEFQWNDCPFCSRKVQVFQEKSNNSQRTKIAGYHGEGGHCRAHPWQEVRGRWVGRFTWGRRTFDKRKEYLITIVFLFYDAAYRNDFAFLPKLNSPHHLHKAGAKNRYHAMT